MSFLQMSLSAGILILGIILFRLLFIRRIPKRVMVILWGIVVLRLLLPFSIDWLWPGIGSLVREEHVIVESYRVELFTVNNFWEAENSETACYVVDLSEKVEWSAIMKGVYLIGAAAMILGSVYLYRKDSSLFKESLPMEKQEKERLIRQVEAGKRLQKDLEKVDFRVSDRTASPVTYGVFCPVMIFPKGIFWKEDREAGFCLLHEMAHIKNHDNLRKLVVHGALCIHWFNPLVWVMYFLFHRDIELLCDEMAVRRCRADRQDYALALLSLAERRTLGFRTALGFGRNAVKERILAVMTAGKTTVCGMLAAAFAVALALTVFLNGSLSAVSAEATSAGEYVATYGDYIAAYNANEATDQGFTVTVTYPVDTAEAAYLIQDTMEAGEIQDTAEIAYLMQGTAETTYDIEAVQEQNTVTETYDGIALGGGEVMENDGLPDSLVFTLKNLADEFDEYGLEIQFSADDYQLYFEGTPVYFFTDNLNPDGESFRGRVYARAAGNGNGNTGIKTKRDENGMIVGLVSLSEEESKEMARAWTGR